MHLDGKVERHKRKKKSKFGGWKIFHSATRKHVANQVTFITSTLLLIGLLAADQVAQAADATSQIMSPNSARQPPQPHELTSQLKPNATTRQHQRDHLRRGQPAQGEPVAPRQPRIYRIRAAGSNGQFATNAALRVGAPPSEYSASDREIEENPSPQNATTTQQQFGARQTSRPKFVVQQQKCAHQQQASPDGEAAAEASSISASSQTLQLAPRPGGGAASRQVVAVQQHRPKLVLQGEQPAAQQVVAANEHSQSLAAAADTSAGTSTTGGLAAEAVADIERQTSGGGGQQTKQVEPSNSNLLSLIDEFDSKITTNKTRAQLSCDSGEMVIKLNFTEPFKGIVYPDHNRLSPCRFFGDGHHNYELRLPLRGCGTRQVAPRVFVNDVIVRFHKTLELEEDEVKTLICRYPPPLDITTSGGGGGAGQQVAAGNGLVHELDSRQHHEQQSQHFNNRPGESALQPNQFELLEPTLATSGAGGRPTNRFGSGAGELETNAFGELLAPPGGHQRQPIGDLINLTPAERILLRQHAKGGLNDNLLMAPSIGASGQQRTNSRLFNPEATGVPLLDERGNRVRGGGGANATTSANYFDRLTSIELLFLISSLMFLVLLALGLAGSYFCLSGRRERTRRRRHQPAALFSSPHQTGGGASGLLQHKRRHFSPAAAGASLYQGAGGTHPAGAGSRYQSPSGQLIAHHSSQQPVHGGQLYNPAAHRPAYYYQQYLAHAQAQNQPPSSPDDSDVSGQMLLPASGVPSGGDTMTSRLASALSGPGNNATVGRRFNYPTAGHYHASTLRPSRSHHQLHTAGQQQQQQVVVGRRGPAHTVQPKTTASAHGQYQAGDQQHSINTLGRRAGRPTPAQASFVSSREPLLKMAPPLLAPPPPVSSHAPPRDPVAANQTLARLRHARSLQQLRKEDADDDDAGAQRDRFGAEHAFGADWLRHNQALVLGDAGGVSGGKPVQRHCSVHARHGHQPQPHLNDHKIKLKQRQHHYDASNLTAPVTSKPAQVAQQQADKPSDATRQQQRQQQVASINYADDDLDATSSDHSSTCSSEITVNERHHRPEENNNDLKVGARPKLILKSIEDSFVTNFTEIYEQEYKHLDTRRPLSMTEWRRASETGRGDRVGSPSSGETSDGHEEGEATWANTLKSSQTNLRSLTELDVNFAKSLLRPSLAATAASQQLAREGVPPRSNDSNQREEQLVRTKSSPQQPVEQQTSKPPNGNNNNNNHNQAEQEDAPREVKAETPDLVISPEYNVGQRLRLVSGGRKELRPTCSSPGGESISYV